MDKQTLPEPFSLEGLLDALVYISVKAKLFQPLRTFFSEVGLEWGKCSTACAFRRNGRRIIMLGRKFFAEQVKTDTLAVHIMLHELMHHLLLHVDVEQMRQMRHRFGKAIEGIAKDAIINAYLHSVDCAGFMEAYYPPRGVHAFLRPNVPFLMRNTGGTVGEVLEFLGCTPQGWRLEDRDPGEPMGAVAEMKVDEMRQFYRNLMELKVTLKEALEFFAEFPRPPKEEPPQLLGDHSEGGEAGDEETESQSPDEGTEENEAEDTGNPSSADSEPGPSEKNGGPGKGQFFSGDEAERTLAEIGIIPQDIQQLFREVISKITERCQKPGVNRTSSELSRKLPKRLHRRDLVNVVAGRKLFRRHQYTSNEVSIYFDLSGSMDRYKSFLVGLINSLNLCSMKVRTFCFADLVKECPVEEFVQGILPSAGVIGFCTNGEAVAQHIQENRVRQAVVVTDNQAGSLDTWISGCVHLCLVEGASEEGTFNEPGKAADCRTHKLYF
jgi:hypothetical protein